MFNYLVLSLGLIAQGLFAGRFVVQLLRSEKTHKVESPALFWQLSLFASFLLVLYGFFRNDIVIVGGQLIGYMIYIRNLQIMGKWGSIPAYFRVSALILPVFLFLFLFIGLNFNWEKFLANPEIDSLLLTWGTFGQVIFTSRFVVQWLYSEKINNSSFPVSFWCISIIGALMIAVYAILREDAVLFIGQAFGLVVYARNLYIHYIPFLNKPIALILKFKNYHLPMLLVFMGMVLFFNLGNWEVSESSEARYAQISKEMLESGDYLHPTLMGIYHYHKPPMTYWITVLAYKLFGVSSWSARVFLQIAILIQIWLVFRIGKLLFGNSKTAIYATLIFSSFSILIISGRALTTDGYLVMFILSAMYAWFLYLKKFRKRYLLAFYLMLGLGFLTKGPVIFVVPLVVLLFQKISQKIQIGSLMIHLSGILIFLLVGMTWFIFLYTEDHRFLDYFIFKHTVQRFSTNSFSRSQPFWFYLAIVVFTAFPWILVILSRGRKLWQERNPSVLMLQAWVFIPLAFFSASQSKLVLYILPIYPAIALLAAWVWHNLPARSYLIWDRVLLVYHLLIILALAISPIFKPQIVLTYKFFFILIIATSILLSLRIIPIKAEERAIFSAVIFIAGIIASSTYFMGNNPNLVNDQKNIVDFIEEELPHKNNILVYDKRMPSMTFLTDRNIISLFDGSEDLNRETQFEKNEGWKKNLINLRQEPDWLLEKVPPSSVLMVNKSRLKKGLVEFPKENFNNQIEIDGWVIFY